MTVSDITPRIAEKAAQDAPAVVVYGRPGCVQCTATTRLLGKLNLPYTYVDVDEDESAGEYVRANWDKLALPAVEVRQGDGITRWSEYLPDSIKALADAA